jgi:hypothetical protein
VAHRHSAAGRWRLVAHALPYDVRTGQFTPNPINRYKVGNNVDGITFGPDGSLDVVISRTDPGPGVNWLPSPADGGPFFLTIRIWQPTQEALDLEWKPEPVIPV